MLRRKLTIRRTVPFPSRSLKNRRGAVLVMAALMMVVVFGFASFAIDVGYITLVRTQLQNAADAAALAAANDMSEGPTAVKQTAKDVALSNYAASEPIVLEDGDIELGFYDLATNTFTPNDSNANAVRVTAQLDDVPLFFAPVIGVDNFSTAGVAISMLNPRDIVFVVDLSGSMNDDTDPCWATAEVDTRFSADYPGIGSSLAQDLFSDYNFGTFPGTTQYVGQPLGVTQNNMAYATMTKDGGTLSSASIPSAYRILSSDSESTRKSKCYKWMIVNQIAVIMPNALPTPNTTTNYTYWEKYLDYIMEPKTVGSGSGVSGGTPRQGSYASVTLPTNQDSERITGFNNPNKQNYPSASSSVPGTYRNKIGYRTYVQFLCDWGRDRSPDVSNSTNASTSVGTKTPASLLSPFCPLHPESVGGTTFQFPPREQPMHALRRALITALQVVDEKNSGIGDNLGDKVAIVSFDAIDAYHTPTVRFSLSSNYSSAMIACTQLQSVSDVNASTSTENGLIKGQEHIKPTSEGGYGRTWAKKVIVLITDGVPNIYQSSDTEINGYIGDNPNEDYYGSSKAVYNAVLMQSNIFRSGRGNMYPVGMGFGTDYDFMDRISRINGTDENGESPRGSGNPAEYETVMSQIFEEIIVNPGSRLVY